jgi:hypothetical protein
MINKPIHSMATATVPIQEQSAEQSKIISTSPQPPQVIKVDGRYFYNSKDLQAFKPEYYYGFTTKPRNIISKKGIPNWEYVYATYEKALTRWNQSNESCKKAQLLISKQWVDENYFKPPSSSSSSTIEKKKIVVMKKKTLQPQTPQQPQQSQPQTPQQPQQSQPQTPQRDSEVLPVHEYEEEEEVLEEENGHQQEVENAPPVLYLDDAEKFHDADGNVIEIETRGERHEDKIYFKVKDVSVGFGMPKLDKTLMNKEKGYTRGTDYKLMFNRSAVTNGDHQAIKKCLFLTYEGMLRVLFASRNKNATLFRKWATNKLFTIQMGTRDQKVKLGAEVLNTSPRTLKAIFDKHAATFPSIYLMSLGKVRELRETFEIPANKPDESTVYKFGFTDDLSRRVIELESEYSKLPGVTMTIGTFHVIDTKYTSEAENEVREMCAAFEVRVKKTTQGFNELIVLDDKQFANMKKMYRRIGDDFAGATLGLQKKIAELKDQMKDYENEIARLKLEIQYKDGLHEKEITIKDTVIENWKLKHQLATMQQRSNN